MNKIYAIVDQNNTVINTILLDQDTSTWQCPPNCWLHEDTDGTAGIGAVYADGVFTKPQDA